jgi:hypothetical protein
MVNSETIRDISNRNFNLELTERISINKKAFFENTSSFNTSLYLVDKITQNNFSAFKDSFKTIFKIKKQFNSVTTINYIVPDLALNKNYWFLDSEITFTSKNNKINYSIIARNLTNNKIFETVNVSDYSRTISSHNLIDRFILGNIAFKF